MSLGHWSIACKVEMNSLYSLKNQGSIQNNLKHGKGTYIFSNGDRYEGEWVNDMKHGKGTFYYGNGELYIGQW